MICLDRCRYYLGKFLHASRLIFIVVLLQGCTAYNRFLVNSRLEVNFDRISGKWFLIWDYNSKPVIMLSDTIKVNDVIIPSSIGKEQYSDSVSFKLSCK